MTSLLGASTRRSSIGPLIPLKGSVEPDTPQPAKAKASATEERRFIDCVLLMVRSRLRAASRPNHVSLRGADFDMWGEAGPGSRSWTRVQADPGSRRLRHGRAS